ncbi:MAG: dihydroxyacetone kinase subunit DhaK [Anaerostipes sp.]|jgi:dihydroxyacetone kinase-like protein|nr:dihydroxyacetone kinase subunit DhaK [Anaerostipes sp.]
MKKMINQPDNYLKEMLEGIYIAHPEDLTCVGGDLQCLVTKHKKEGKVGLVTGGGSGHLPLFLGYVGKGMLDGCCVGDVFQSPSVDQAVAVTREVDSGAGVLYIYGNYNGDIFTFDPAADEVDMEDDIRVETVLGADDVASAGPSAPGEKSTRRGVAGIFFVYKCAGAAAEKMLSLDEVKRIADKANQNVRTMGVALTPCTVPRVGKPSFEIAEDEMEIGMGIHGEQGIRRGKIEPADQVVDEMLDQIVADLPYERGDSVAVLVNGLGATPLDEQYIVTRRIHENLGDKGIKVHKYYVGEYATSIEMAGFSISLLKLDDELTEMLDKNADTPFFKQI